MCHAEVPESVTPPPVRREEVAIPLQSREAMPGLLALPDRLPAPAVLLVHDIMGRSPFYEHVACELAHAGFVALEPEFFFRLGQLAGPTLEDAIARAIKLDQQRTLADLGEAIQWLHGRDDVTGGLGTLGFCMGGTLVLGLAGTRDDIAASVVYYGFPKLKQPPSPLAPPEPLDVAAQMRGEILGHWGELDDNVGIDNVEALRGRLERAGVAHTFHIYPGVGHGFLKSLHDPPGSPAHDEAAKSWRRTLGWLRSSLAKEAGQESGGRTSATR